jgi:oligoendopeptidase F
MLDSKKNLWKECCYIIMESASKRSGKSWGPLKKEYKDIRQHPLNSPQDIQEIFERFTPIYDTVEKETVIKAMAYLCYGKPKFLVQGIWYALRVTYPFYRARGQLLKRVYNASLFNSLPSELTQLQRLIRKEIKMKPSLFLLLREYLYVMRSTNRLSGIRVEFEGKKLSLPKMRPIYESTDRSRREQAWRAAQAQLHNEAPVLNKYFDLMRKIRFKQARKAGFTNTRDYYHEFKGRVDYTPEDCYHFHDAIEKVVVPFIRELNLERQTRLGIPTLRPWDKMVPLDESPLKPYENLDDLIEKMVKVFSKLNPQYGDMLQRMHQNGWIDFENRKGKTPGAMCLPLSQERAGFILGNAAGVFDDVLTLAHEGGHALHACASADLKISLYRDALLLPMELAEVASMSMEFLIFDELKEFFPHPSEIVKAKRKALEGAIRFLPWCAMVDAFQHWIYTNPNHTAAERNAYFATLIDRFEVATGVDYSGLEGEKGIRWITQGHIFQSPFYYIEYGISQIAAFGIYRNYKMKGKAVLEDYHKFISLGYSRPIPEIYQAAGIKFDFSADYLQEIVNFLREEFKTLK